MQRSYDDLMTKPLFIQSAERNDKEVAPYSRFPKLDKANVDVSVGDLYTPNPLMPNTVMMVPSNIARALINQSTGAVMDTVGSQHCVVNNGDVHGSRAVTVLASFKDEMCGNQVIYSTEAATQAHTIGYDPEVLEDFIMNRVMKAPKDIRTLQNWAHKEVRETDLRRILYSNPQISSGAVAAIVKQFNTIEVLKRGSNLLALLSAITSWGSHNNDDFRVRNSGNTDNEAEVLFARQEKIAKLLGSDAFLQVAA